MIANFFIIIKFLYFSNKLIINYYFSYFPVTDQRFMVEKWWKIEFQNQLLMKIIFINNHLKQKINFYQYNYNSQNYLTYCLIMGFLVMQLQCLDHYIYIIVGIIIIIIIEKIIQNYWNKLKLHLKKDFFNDFCFMSIFRLICFIISNQNCPLLKTSIKIIHQC